MTVYLVISLPKNTMYTPYIYTWFWPTLHIYTHIHPYPYPHPTVHKILPQPQSNTAHSTTKKLAFAAGPKLLVAGRAIGHAHASAPAPMYLPVRVYMCASVCSMHRVQADSTCKWHYLFFSPKARDTKSVSMKASIELISFSNIVSVIEQSSQPENKTDADV
jgi:hypothetical protein